jgi:DNA helicase-2/ATP-dependent DNA helicase PcrA
MGRSARWARRTGIARRVDSTTCARGAASDPNRRTIDYSFSQEDSGDVTGAIRVGTRVRHPQFGAGVVRWREGSGDGAKLTVQFERAGVKKLMLRFAPLEILA